MKRTPVADLPIPVVADIAEYAVMTGFPFSFVLDIYYGRDALSMMGFLHIQGRIRSLVKLRELFKRSSRESFV